MVETLNWQNASVSAISASRTCGAGQWVQGVGALVGNKPPIWRGR